MENINAIIEAINSNKLILGNELRNKISENYQIEIFSKPEIEIDDMFITNYEIKLESINKVDSEYGKLLTKTTVEMISKIRKKLGEKMTMYKVFHPNKKVYFRIGFADNSRELLFIHKLVTPRELSEEEKRMVESGKYVRMEMDFNE